jgi:hypothetical protein
MNTTAARKLHTVEDHKFINAGEQTKISSVRKKIRLHDCDGLPRWRASRHAQAALARHQLRNFAFRRSGSTVPSLSTVQLCPDITN